MTRERLFGTDGVRGRANTTLTSDTALRLGAATGHWVHDLAALSPNRGRPQIVIGRDTRISCDMLESALAAGITSMGVDVMLIGVVPTPAVSHAVLTTQSAAGIVISASHNPYPDNGIKFFGSNGAKLPDSVEDTIESILGDLGEIARPEGGDIGRIRKSTDPVSAYVRHVVATLPDHANLPLAGLSVVLDCANGAAYRVAPRIFKQLGAKVALIHASPNGVNINVECGSTQPASMAQAVVRRGANVGLAFDGDADRVMLADEHGAIVDGDRMMAIIAGHLHASDRLAGDVVVATIMSNVGLEQALQKRGIRLHRTDVGDRYVAEAMSRLGASIGGEQSGHILLPDITPTGDGIVTGLQVLRVMHESSQPLSRLAAVVSNCPQRLESVRVTDRVGWRRDMEIQAAIEAAERRLGSPQWLSVRASGTEPLIRIMAQGTETEVVDSIVEELLALVYSKFGVRISP